MIDLYLRLSAKSDMPTVLAAFYRQDTGTETDPETGEKTVTPVGEPYLVTATHDYAIDVVGTIYRPTGNMIADDDGNEYPETAPIPGWHVNLRFLTDAMQAEAQALSEWVVSPAPKSPARVWAT